MPACAQTLAAAFAQDPWIAWTVPEQGRHERLVELFGLFGEYAAAAGEIWVTEPDECVAMWLPPQPPDPPPELAGRMADRLPVLQSDRMIVAEQADRAVAARRPRQPAWYLATMGTNPSVQGRGRGTAVLAPVLARCDRAGEPALADTSTSANVRFYARQGFAVHDELDVPGGGPHVWLLWRAPRST